MSELIDKEQKYRRLIIGLSIIIPLAVALLFGVRIEGYNTSFLPPIYATMNGITALLLVAGIVAIKNGQRAMHQKLMSTAIIFSALFLVLYVVYHATSDSTPFGGEGWIRPLYYFILISHIVLSVVVIPLVLFTYVRAWAGNFERHKKLARITFPVWLYVAVTGVLVYVMISPYYV
jgi:putative membrane protein